MNLFTLIKTAQPFAHLLNNNNIYSEKKLQNESYNFLTYAIATENIDALKELIEFIKIQPEKDKIIKFLLNLEHLKPAYRTFISKNNYIPIILENLELDDPQKIYLMNTVLNSNRYGNAKYNIADIQRLTSYLKINNYEELYELKEKGHYVDEFMDCFIETNFDWYLSKFKDYLKNYSLYHPYINLTRNDDDKVSELKAFVDKIEDTFMKVQTEQEFNEALTQLPDQINLAFRKSKNQTIFLGNTRSSIYLKTNEHFQKLQFFKDFIKSSQSYGNSDDNFLLKNFVINRYLEPRINLDSERLEKLFEEKKIKHLSVAKSSNLQEVEHIIEHGCFLIENHFELSPEQIGATQLCLEFTIEKSIQNGAAGSTPGGNLITFYMQSTAYYDIMEVGPRHFLHEFTHYMQDRVYYLSNINYDEKGKSFWADNQHWQKIRNDLTSLTASLKDIEYYVSGLTEDIFSKMDDHSKEGIKKFIIDNFNDSDLSEKLNLYLKSILGESQEIWGQSYYKVNKEKIYPYIIEQFLKSLEILQKSYSSQNFLITMWQHLDKDRGDDYFLNPLEMHARLTEKLTDMEMNGYQTLHYPTNELMKKIKPSLVAFNKMLTTQYNYCIPIEMRKKPDYWNRFYDNNLDDKIAQMRLKYSRNSESSHYMP